MFRSPNSASLNDVSFFGGAPPAVLDEEIAKHRRRGDHHREASGFGVGGVGHQILRGGLSIDFSSRDVDSAQHRVALFADLTKTRSPFALQTGAAGSCPRGAR